MRLEQRIARLEMAAKGLQDSGDAVLLSPNDVALLIIERGRIAESDAPEAFDYLRRIDALLDGHNRAARRCPPKALTPAEAAMALEEAEERQQRDNMNGVSVAERSRMRTEELVGKAL